MFTHPWLRKADQAAADNEWFEAFICLWVVFNAWSSHVVADREQSEDDTYLWQAACLDSELASRFEKLLRDGGSFRNCAESFWAIWPVFKVRTLVDHGIGPWDWEDSRRDYRATCFQKKLNIGDFGPQCYLDHQLQDAHTNGGDPLRVPLDWRHSLAAIYKVRCNLFHGGKSFLNSGDIRFCEFAYRILDSVWRPETGA